MRKTWNTLILLLTLVATACDTSTASSPSVSISDITPTQHLLLSPSPPYMFNITRTAIPSATATLTPKPSTFTSVPIPEGLLTAQELKQQIDDWVNRDIEFTDEGRLLDEKTGELVGLGLLAQQPIDMVIFVFYNLGFTVILDQEGIPYLINLVGFEDAQGQRFTIIFHNGSLFEQDALINLVEFQGRGIKSTTIISHDQLLPYEFAQVASKLPLGVFTGITFTDGSTGSATTNKYLRNAKETTKTLAIFLSCKYCSIGDAPSMLTPIINSIPEVYEQNIPYLPDYKFYDW